MVDCKYGKINTPYIETIKLSHDKAPFFTKYYGNDKIPLVCGHKDENLDENMKISTPGHKLKNSFAANVGNLFSRELLL